MRFYLGHVIVSPKCRDSSLATIVSLVLAMLFGLASLPLMGQQNQGLDTWAQRRGVSVFTPHGVPTKFTPDTSLSTSLSQLQQGLENSGYGVLGYREYVFVVLPNERLVRDLGADYFENLRAARQAATDEALSDVGATGRLTADGRAELSGMVLDGVNAEPVIGAVIKVGDGGTTTDATGRYRLQLAPGITEMTVSYVGYADAQRRFNLRGNGTLNIELLESAQTLDEVVVTGRSADANVSQTIAGISSLDLKQLERSATLLGEADVVRGLLLNPGVTTVGEGATGFNVRGGEVDQNLLLQDEIVLFNASHALGFFSTFNADMVRAVDLYKGGVPPEYSARLASALQVDMRDGNREQTRWSLTAGPVTGRGTLEGPLKKGRSSYIVGVRSSYVNWLLNLVNIPEVQRTRAFFLDGNARLSFRMGESDGLILSAYGSTDDFVYDDTFGFNYYTRAGQATYNKSLGGDNSASFTVVASDYFSEQQDRQGLDAATLSTGVAYLKAKAAFRLKPSDELGIDAGLQAQRITVQRGDRTPFNEASLVSPLALDDQQGLESYAYADANWELSDRFSVVAGARLSHYRQLGPGTVNTYGDSGPSAGELIDSTVYADGETIYSETNLDPRLSLRFKVGTDASLKLGYSRSTQYINQIFNGDSPTPSSQYQLTTTHIPSFRAHSASLGLFRNFRDDTWETSAEVYYRYIDRLWDYRDFANLAANPTLETEILVGEGRAYGAELSLKRTRGDWYGWLSYTYSRTERQVPGINRGRFYPSNFDQPHNARLVLNYDISMRASLNANFTYSTGRPTTAPITNYRVSNGLIVPVFSERNQVRIPDYHRLDLALTVGRGYDQTRKVQTKWTLSVYNVYGRKNAFSVYYTQSADQANVANRLALLGSVFPSLTLTLSPT